LAGATSAEKKQGSRAPRGPKVSNNFGSVQARRNPAHGAKIDGGVAEAEAAGGSPRKKPHGPSPPKKPRGEETFLFRLDRVKATAEHGRTEPLELKGDPDDRADGGRPKEGVLKTMKAPRVTQEDDGDDLDSEEEEVDSKDDDDFDDDDDNKLNADGDEAARRSYTTRGAADDPKAAAFAVGRARRARAVAPRVRYEGSGNDEAKASAVRRVDAYAPSAAASSVARRAHVVSGPTYKATASAARRAPTARAAVRTSEAKSSPARPRGAKRGSSASDRTDGGRPK
jgi:hypothetical protein